MHAKKARDTLTRPPTLALTPLIAAEDMSTRMNANGYYSPMRIDHDQLRRLHHARLLAQRRRAHKILMLEPQSGPPVAMTRPQTAESMHAGPNTIRFFNRGVELHEDSQGRVKDPREPPLPRRWNAHSPHAGPAFLPPRRMQTGHMVPPHALPIDHPLWMETFKDSLVRYRATKKSNKQMPTPPERKTIALTTPPRTEDIGPADRPRTAGYKALP